MDNVFNIIKNFSIEQNINSITEYGNGNINDTFLIRLEENNKRYLLQKINTNVFAKPESLMNNMHIVTQHIQESIEKSNSKWKVFDIIKTHNNRNYWASEDNLNSWRVISFIENAQCFDVINTKKQAFELGAGLGKFHCFVSDLNPNKLVDILEGFHITPSYLKHYDKVMKKVNINNDYELKYAINFIEKNRDCANILEVAKSKNILPIRVIHGDPKVNNIMFDRDSGRAISIIDLDTVKAGLIHYDIGDCIRSSCNPIGEEAGNEWDSVYFEMNNFHNILEGYMSSAKIFLTNNDFKYIYESAFIITFELGIRFFTDYLEGNIYFSKISYPKHNLHRALTQFKLAEDIKKNKEDIVSIIEEVK